MNETERWIREAKGHLKAARKSGKEQHIEALQEHMRRMDFDRALADLGCGEECEKCSWGQLGGYPLRQTCHLVAFLNALEGLQAGQGPPAPAGEVTAALQELLDRLPACREQ